MKEVKIIACSDTHGLLPDNLPSGDILTISGDICEVRMSHHPTSQYWWIKNNFIPWCDMLIKEKIFKHICFCPGNHDFVFESIINYSNKYPIIWPKYIHCLIDKTINIMGVKIHGTPWTPQFGNWAFMGDYVKLEKYFKYIPKGTDIILSHSPANGYNDIILEYINDKAHLGSTALIDRLNIVSGKWLLCGHIHSGNHNIEKIIYDDSNPDGYINSVNVSLINENYDHVYKPFNFTIKK